ncbi:MAG: hypothetical protein R3B06_18915 [Kofleriaceae bacterium]
MAARDAWRWAVAAACVAVAGGAAADDGTDRDGDGAVVERAELVIGPGRHAIGGIAIDNVLGDVRVEGYDGDSVQVVAVKHAPDAAALARLRVTVVPDPSGEVRLSTSLAERGGKAAVALATVRIDLTVRVPRAATVTGRVATGRLEVRDLDAGADLDSSTGPIVVRNVAGSVFARSLDGSQRFEEVFGTLDSHAIDGDLSFDSVRGATLTAQAYAGDVSGRRVGSRQVRVSSIDGQIDLDAEAVAGGAVTVTSLRGAVAVRLHAPGGAAVRTRAGGRLVMPDGAGPSGRWVESQFGTVRSRAAVRVESRFGDVSFSLVQ